MAEIQIQELSWYQELAKQNRRGLVPMTFLENAMPHRIGDIAGFIPEQARKMHVDGQAVPYIGQGKKAPKAGSRAAAVPSGADAAETARLDAIELTAGIFAEDPLVQVNKAKEIKGVDPKSKLDPDEAKEILRAELARREAAAADDAAGQSGAVTSKQVPRNGGANG